MDRKELMTDLCYCFASVNRALKVISVFSRLC